MKTHHSTPEERASAISRVDALRKEGKSIKAACLELGMPHATYFNWTRGKKSPPKRKYTKRAAPVIKQVDFNTILPSRINNEKLTLIVAKGNPSDIGLALRGILNQEM